MAIFPTRPRTVDLIGWALLSTAMIFALYVRVRLREFPLERDEGEFAYAGQLILQGVPPYTDKLAYNMKLPGTYLAYAALMAVFGQTTAGVHLGLLAVNLATIVLLYRFVREIFDPFSAGMAAVAYSVLSLSPAMLGMAAHATHFVAFFGLAGAYLLWRHLQSGRWWQAAASGLLMGIAFLMKQQGVFLMIFGGAVMAVFTVAVLVNSYRRGSFSPQQMLHLTLNAAIYCVGAVLPYLLICLWLWHAGVFKKFWFWTVTYARQYVGEIPLSWAGAYLWQNGSHIVGPNWPLMLLALVGIAGVAILGRCKPGMRSFVFSFLTFSFFCVCPGYYFREHYFIVMLPAVAMFVGVGCRLLWDLASGRFWAAGAADPASGKHDAPMSAVREKRARSKKVKSGAQSVTSTNSGPSSPLVVALSGLVALLLAAAVGWTLFGTTFIVTPWVQGDFFFRWEPHWACRVVYNGNPFVECPLIANYLKEHTAPNETLAILGSEPEVFFDAQRKSATGYIYTYGLMEAQPLAESMQEEMQHEIETAKPRFIVVVDVRFSWLYGPGSKFHIQDWANRYLRERYDVVGIVEQSSNEKPIEHWAESGVSFTPQFQPVRNARGETRLGCVGSLAGYQPNPSSECVLWICRRKGG